MTVCTKTGLSQEQQKRWSYLYHHLTEDLEIPDLSTMDEKSISKLGAELGTILKRIGDAKAKSRESLTQHLKGLLTRRFKRNAIVEAFGSSVTNLSIGTGDLDICLSFKCVALL